MLRFLLLLLPFFLPLETSAVSRACPVPAALTTPAAKQLSHGRAVAKRKFYKKKKTRRQVRLRFGKLAMLAVFLALPLGLIWAGAAALMVLLAILLAAVGLFLDDKKWPAVLALLLLAVVGGLLWSKWE